MLNHQPPLDRIFHALSDPGRLAIVARLGDGPASVGDLAGPLAMSLPRALQHLKVLEDVSIIRSEKKGRTRVCSLTPEGLSPAADWIARRRASTEARLDRLGDLLENAETENGGDAS